MIKPDLIRDFGDLPTEEAYPLFMTAQGKYIEHLESLINENSERKRDLFSLMIDEHGLTLLDSELNDIFVAVVGEADYIEFTNYKVQKLKS